MMASSTPPGPQSISNQIKITTYILRSSAPYGKLLPPIRGFKGYVCRMLKIRVISLHKVVNSNLSGVVKIFPQTFL